ncbi:hypothetical protein FWG86_00835 [Candidatus Saccharibacteria bacterium]|nr:hypothetical protein [Candidatus Saccharibacteria bacterium]
MKICVKAINARGFLSEQEQAYYGSCTAGIAMADELIAAVQNNFNGIYYGRGDRELNNAQARKTHYQHELEKFGGINFAIS